MVRRKRRGKSGGIGNAHPEAAQQNDHVGSNFPNGSANLVWHSHALQLSSMLLIDMSTLKKTIMPQFF